MDVMTKIRQMQAEAFLSSGLTPDEVAAKFPSLSKAQSLKDRCHPAIAARRASNAKRLAARKTIIEDGIKRGLSYADIGLLISKAEGRTPPLSAQAVWQYMKNNGIRGAGSGANLRGPKRGPRQATRDIGQLCEMMREHFTSDQIALILGISKNTVVGHWFRNRNAG